MVYKKDELSRALRLAKKCMDDYNYRLVEDFAEDMVSQGLSVGRNSKLKRIWETCEKDRFERKEPLVLFK